MTSARQSKRHRGGRRAGRSLLVYCSLHAAALSIAAKSAPGANSPRPPSWEPMLRSLLARSWVAAGLVLAVGAPTTAAQPVPTLDSARLLSDLSVLAHDSMEGRAPGSLGSLRAQAFLERSLTEAGTEPVGDGYRHAFEWSGQGGVNLVGLVPGLADSSQVIVLTAHYDHLGIRAGEIYNGADDNASGAAALLEIARQIAASPLQHSLLLALVDAEEAGLQGARALVADPVVPLDRISLNVNLDMVARTDGVLWAGGAYHTPALRPVLERIADRAPLVLRLGHDRPGAPEGDDWTDASDHAPFHRVGIPFVYFGVEDHADYHRATDDFERIDPGEYLAAVRTILMALRALDGALPLEGNNLR